MEDIEKIDLTDLTLQDASHFMQDIHELILNFCVDKKLEIDKRFISLDRNKYNGGTIVFQQMGPKSRRCDLKYEYARSITRYIVKIILNDVEIFIPEWGLSSDELYNISANQLLQIIEKLDYELLYLYNKKLSKEQMSQIPKPYRMLNGKEEVDERKSMIPFHNYMNLTEYNKKLRDDRMRRLFIADLA